MKRIPENFTRLHIGEEELRATSIDLIEASEDMPRHVEMIETCMDMLQHVRTNTPEMSEDQVIVAIIGASLFNSTASTFKLLLSGYYQSSGLQIRYILESGWLLDYLGTDSKLVQQWNVASEAERQKKFGPGFVRDQLDQRDGFTKKKRAEHYKRLWFCVAIRLLRAPPCCALSQAPTLVWDHSSRHQA